MLICTRKNNFLCAVLHSKAKKKMDPIEVTENIICCFPFLKSANLDKHARKICGVVAYHNILKQLVTSLKVGYIHETYIFCKETKIN